MTNELQHVIFEGVYIRSCRKPKVVEIQKKHSIIILEKPESMSYQIVITDSTFSTETPENEIFGREGYELVRLQCRDEKELQVRLGPVDAVLVQTAPITAPVIEAMRNCKVIVRYGHSVDNIDLHAARSRGIPVWR